jgi:hypothetical protein
MVSSGISGVEPSGDALTEKYFNVLNSLGYKCVMEVHSSLNSVPEAQLKSPSNLTKRTSTGNI